MSCNRRDNADRVTVSPLQSAEIKYFSRGYQWCPRGAVLRCLVEDDENGQLVVGIDDQELSLEEFGVGPRVGPA